MAEDFELAVRHALQLLTSMPSLGTPAYRNSRLWPLKPFEYTLVYRVVGDELVVLAMAHQRRAAGYWRGRADARSPQALRIKVTPGAACSDSPTASALPSNVTA
ncbi:MAG: type II toxin-antitoxin system RelE/ParE family toxin [Burkholderiaceae bacterium]|nr:type II toxin-antitoxin system RelE/ParE family toxin [Burkholderiaceae bacterium]